MSVPYDVALEQALLGAVLADAQHFEQLSGSVTPEYFFDPLHRRIWDAAITLSAKSRPFTPLTAHAYLEGDEGLISVGGLQYLMNLARSTSISPNVVEYARLLRELAARREMIVIAEEMAAAARADPVEGLSVEAIANEAFDAIYNASRGNAPTDGLVSFIDLAHGALKDVESAIANPKSAYITSGLRTVDEALGGLYRGDLTIIAGSTSMGKSSLATCICLANAQEGRRALLFTPEMRGRQIALRILSQQVKIPSDKLRRGQLTDRQFGELVLAPRAIGDIPLKIDGSPSPRISQIHARVLNFSRRHGKPALIAIDHLQEVAGENPRQDRFEQIGQITKDFRALAEEFGAAGVLISHLGRDPDRRTNHRPQLGDLYGSSFIEKNADAVWFLLRPSYYLEREEPEEKSGKEYDRWLMACDSSKGKAEVFAAKQRMGPLGSAQVKFNDMLTLFSDFEGATDAVSAQDSLALARD
jgi:replicative DNA helicase